MTSPTPLLPGDPNRVGHYLLRGRLGAGGMGVVYLAEDQDGQQVAIKVIRPEFAADPSYLERFRREAELARRVARSCVAQVLDANFNGSRPYLVTEYVAGANLDEHVRECGPLSQGNLEAVALGVAAALAAIHRAGLVHRDLKPSNVVLSNYYGPRVIDFGVARSLDETSRLTTGHGQPGTPAFMAPEQARVGQVTAAADVFAWGGLVIFAATSELPFARSGGLAPAEREPDLSDLRPPLRELVASALAKNPSRRPAALDLVHRLLGDGRTPVADPQAEATERVQRSWDPATALEDWPASPSANRHNMAATTQHARESTTPAEPTSPAGSWPVEPTEQETRDVLAAYARRHWLVPDTLFDGGLQIADRSSIWLQEQWIEESRSETWERPIPGSAPVEPNLPKYSGSIHDRRSQPITWSNQLWRGLRRDSVSVVLCACAVGKVRCPRCEGHGSIPCRSCHGKNSADCGSCRGRGWQTCPKKNCTGGHIRCPTCQGHLRYTQYMTGTIQQVLHVTPEPPPPDYHLVETMLDRFDPATIPNRYRSAVGGQPRQAPGAGDLRRRFLLFVLPRFEVGYHDGTAARTAFLVGNPPERKVRDVDEHRLPVRLLRLHQLLSRLLSQIRGNRPTPGQPRLASRIALTVAALTFLSVGLVLLAIHFSGR
jgi:serine/threonine protein kinase